MTKLEKQYFKLLIKTPISDLQDVLIKKIIHHLDINNATNITFSKTKDNDILIMNYCNNGNLKTYMTINEDGEITIGLFNKKLPYILTSFINFDEKLIDDYFI